MSIYAKFLLLLLSISGVYGEYLNLGRVDANRTLEEYKNFNETFNSAYMAFLKEFWGLQSLSMEHIRRLSKRYPT